MLIRKTQQPSDYPENQIHDAYSTSTTDTYSCNYINSKLSIKQVSGLSLGHGATLQDDVIKKANQVTVYYTMNNDRYRHSETIQKNDTEWHFDTFDVYTMFIKVDWASGTLVTSPYDANSKIIGYDLLYTDN